MMDDDAVRGDDARAREGGRLRDGYVEAVGAPKVNSVKGAWLRKSEAPSAIAWRRP